MIPRVVGTINVRATDVRAINAIIATLNARDDPLQPGVLYLGYAQRNALQMVKPGDPCEVKDGKFYGWPVVWVAKAYYIHATSIDGRVSEDD